jgi:hypothetical protein
MIALVLSYRCGFVPRSRIRWKEAVAGKARSAATGR